MQITDTIADLLTRIRNAQSAKHDTVDIPASNMKKAICQILVDEGYVKSFTVTEDGKQGVITVTLKYVEGGVPAIKGLPGSLLDAGDLALVSQLTEADTADTVLAQVSMGTTADLAAVVSAGRELGGTLLLELHRSFCHVSSLP